MKVWGRYAVFFRNIANKQYWDSGKDEEVNLLVDNEQYLPYP